jgi:hypothetical protein
VSCDTASAPDVLHERYDLKGSWVNRHRTRIQKGQFVSCRFCNQKFRFEVGLRAGDCCMLRWESVVHDTIVLGEPAQHRHDGGAVLYGRRVCVCAGRQGVSNVQLPGACEPPARAEHGDEGQRPNVQAAPSPRRREEARRHAHCRRACGGDSSSCRPSSRIIPHSHVPRTHTHTS